MKQGLLIGALVGLLSSCATPQPQHLNNACSMFMQDPSWYWATLSTEKKWGVDIGTQLAIMYQESHFSPEIRPPREYLLGFIPWFRESTAFGYTQALDGTWRRYQYATKNYSANRDDFADATDFIGWYGNLIRKSTGQQHISAYTLYLAYHEGIQGYRTGTYRQKTWLINLARKLQTRADLYNAQLLKCSATLPSKPWYHFW